MSTISPVRSGQQLGIFRLFGAELKLQKNKLPKFIMTQHQPLWRVDPGVSLSHYEVEVSLDVLDL